MEIQYVELILKVLVYIEDHLEEELRMGELAKIAGYSPFYFHRIFQLIVGETLHKYIRRLRLEKAAGKLRYTNDPITDIALDTQFDTPSAFTRAFKQFMGSSPRNYRLLYQEVNAMTKKMNEFPMIHPDTIEILSDTALWFIRKQGSYSFSSQLAWESMLTFIQKEGLDKVLLRYFSVAHDDPTITNEDQLRFDACIQPPKGLQLKNKIASQIFKGGKYAIFIHYGPHDTLDNTFDRIFLKWIPNSREHCDDSRPIVCEHFHLEYVGKDESKLETKIYIPIE